MAKPEKQAPERVPPAAAAGVPPALLGLLEMGRRARNAASADELAFMLVNGSHSLTPYRQAALWWSDTGVQALSGVIQPDQNAPYVDWLKQVFKARAALPDAPVRISPAELPEAVGQAWADWLPAHAVLLPLPGPKVGAFLMARDTEWTDGDLALQQEWCQTWLHAWRACTAPKGKPVWVHWRNWRGATCCHLPLRGC